MGISEPRNQLRVWLKRFPFSKRLSLSHVIQYLRSQLDHELPTGGAILILFISPWSPGAGRPSFSKHQSQGSLQIPPFLSCGPRPALLHSLLPAWSCSGPHRRRSPRVCVRNHRGSRAGEMRKLVRRARYQALHSPRTPRGLDGSPGWPGNTCEEDEG